MKQSASFQGLRIDHNSIINLEKGKIPPQALDLEEVVLGAMMIDKKGVDEVIDILTAEAFYKESHQFIFEAIHKLFQKSEPIDPNIVILEIGLNFQCYFDALCLWRGVVNVD